MAEQPQKNLVTRLADAGEEAIQRLGGAPGGDKLVGAVNNLRTRTDEMQKRLRGLDEVKERLLLVEERLDKLEGKTSSKPSSSSASSTKKSPRPDAGAS
jgi:hypothetical protein